MPRYFFHFRDDHGSLGHVDTVLPDSGAARLAAIKMMGKVLSGEAEKMTLSEMWHLEVVDGAEAPVFALQIHSTSTGRNRRLAN
ncbi:hypothetical protein MRF4_19415 [Methylobacterium radiotolerans]|uniref:DUF6894 family protein n=1 Tax=Methylobacterium TaxID=407 RepID=UPI002F348D4A